MKTRNISVKVPFSVLACSAVVVATLAHGIDAQAPADGRNAALARRAAERQQTLQREADQLASEERTLLVDLRRLDVDRQLKIEEMVRVDAELRAIGAQLDDTATKIREIEGREQKQRPGLEARLVELYKLGQGGYLRQLLSVSDLRQFGRAYRTVSALARLDRDRFAAHQQNLDNLKDARASLEQRSAETVHLQDAARRARGEAEHAVAARSQLIAQIDARRDLNAQLVGELQSAQQKLQRVLAGVGGTATDHQPAVDLPGLPLRPFRGDLAWPVSGRILTLFGREHAGRAGASIVPNGIEIAAPEGTPAAAVHEGLVAYADPFTGFGNLVIVDHGDQAYSLYGHLASIALVKGGRVDRGQVVGTVGAAPAGPAGLYFELRVDGKPVDPVQWLRKR